VLNVSAPKAHIQQKSLASECDPQIEFCEKIEEKEMILS
jgi:hypothetical protein